MWGWKDFQGCKFSSVPPSPPRPALPTPEGEHGSQGVAGAEQPERPLYLVAGARPGREGAGACGRRGPPRLPAQLEPGFRGYFWKPRPERCTRLLQGPELRKGAKIKRGNVSGSPPPNAIHNPADRKERSTSLPAVSLGNVPLPTCCGNLCFSLLMLVRAGTDSKRATGNRLSGGAER